MMKGCRRNPDSLFFTCIGTLTGTRPGYFTADSMQEIVSFAHFFQSNS